MPLPAFRSVLLALGVTAITALPASAQTGMFGSAGRTSGGSISASGRNAFGSSGAGAGGIGQAGTGLDQLGSTGQITGTERFLRDNRSAAQFVGSDQSDSGFVGASTGNTGTGMAGGMRGGAGGFGATGGLGGMSGMGGFGTGGFGGMGGIGGAGGLGGFGGIGSAAGRGGFGGAAGRGGMRGNFGNSNRQINVRTQMEIGFRYQRPAAPAVQTNVARYVNTDEIGRLGPIEVQMEGATAVLRGRVATPSDRRLAIRLAKLEPGVETVRDELQVDSTTEDQRSPSDQ